MHGFTVSLEQKGIDEATKLLAGLGNGSLAMKAMKAAMARTTQYVGTQASKRITEEYDISKRNLRLNENIRIKTSYSLTGVQADISFSNEKIPLFRYNGTSPKVPTYSSREAAFMKLAGIWVTGHPGIAAKAHQKKSTSPTVFENAFVAQMPNGHIGIFERISNRSSKIKELKGSSVAQMIGNEDVIRTLEDDAQMKFKERLMHETIRLLSKYE